MEKPRFSVVGMGKVGSALTESLKKAGYRFVKTPSHAIELLIFAVPDAKISELALKFSKLPLNFSNLTVLHTAGALSAEVLKPFELKHCAVAAFHPFQTFPQKNRKVNLQGISFGIDGNKKGVRVAKQLAKDLGGTPLLIPAKKRALYHAAAVMSSGFMATNLDMAIRALKKTGLSEKQALSAVTAIAQETIRNAEQLGVKKAMTGPAVRGDKATIALHLKALKKDAPDAVRVYREMTRAIQKRK